ncbi:MAG: hypothetical protein JWO25_385 [Alphaproteobacteria bacterium]|nr:hypothetical protein [Alphaproteobacteria bacterium]
MRLGWRVTVRRIAVRIDGHGDAPVAALALFARA